MQVPMRGGKVQIPEPRQQTPATRKLTGGISSTRDSESTPSKLRQLAAEQLAILSASAQPTPCAPSDTALYAADDVCALDNVKNCYVITCSVPHGM